MAFRRLAILAFWICASGCGGPGSQGNIVKGVVTVGGKPAAGATIRFFDDSDQCVAAASVNDRGEYIATDVPKKTLRVAFDQGVASGIYASAPPPGTTPLPGSSSVPPAEIPEKFRKPGSSGLTATVTSAEQTTNFSLD